MSPENLASATATTATATATATATLCDSCHSLPSSVYCHADAAFLCSLCDSSVHSANPLARRHHRAPLLPIAAGGLIAGGLSVALPKVEEDDKDCFFTEAEVDQYFDLVEFSTSCEEEEGKENFDCKEEEEEEEEEKQMLLQTSFNLESDEVFKAGMDYSVFLPHMESVSSMEATVVPENSMSSSEFRASKGTIEIFSGPPIQQFTAMDREARVLRYREKRKTRKFQKIIRYASRKAYAETRPRIKGRFAKRTDAELEVDQMFAAPVMVEAGYGVVHSY